MKKTVCAVLLAICFLALKAQQADETAIKKVLAAQVNAWNKGDIDGFMKGYWKNDSLQFIGKSGVVYGFATTLATYKKNYDSPDKMGTLYFSETRVRPLSHDYCFVTSRWLLKRTVGDVGGFTTLLFRKVNGEWVIVSDHTS